MSRVPRLQLLDYSPPLSLWRLVEEQVCHSQEQQEVKRILGESLVDQSLELHEEVKTLTSIWEEVRQQGAASDRQVSPALPEPPQQRERLVQEICFFVENVRDKAKHQGLDPEKLLSRHNSSVIDYALETQRPGSSRSFHDRPLSSRVISPSDRRSGDILEDVQSNSVKLNYLDLDEVLQNLRHSLEEEIECLLRDITYLQERIDDEITQQSVTDRDFGLSREPTLTELKEERSALEKELLTPENTIPVIPLKSKPIFKPQTPPRMHSIAAPLGKCDHTNSSGPRRPGPVKAIHNLSRTKTPESSRTSPSDGCLSPSQVSLHDTTVLDKPVHRRNISPNRVKFVSVGSILSPEQLDSSREHAAFLPSPPTPTKPVNNRPSSADRFRRRVLQCRDGT